MTTFNRSAVVLFVVAGILVGLILGLVVGWVLWPVTYFDTDLSDLSTHHKEEYLSLIHI